MLLLSRVVKSSLKGKSGSVSKGEGKKKKLVYQAHIPGQHFLRGRDTEMAFALQKLLHITSV